MGKNSKASTGKRGGDKTGYGVGCLGWSVLTREQLEELHSCKEQLTRFQEIFEKDEEQRRQTLRLLKLKCEQIDNQRLTIRKVADENDQLANRLKENENQLATQIKTVRKVNGEKGLLKDLLKERVALLSEKESLVADKEHVISETAEEVRKLIIGLQEANEEIEQTRIYLAEQGRFLIEVKTENTTLSDIISRTAEELVENETLIDSQRYVVTHMSRENRELKALKEKDMQLDEMKKEHVLYQNHTEYENKKLMEVVKEKDEQLIVSQMLQLVEVKESLVRVEEENAKVDREHLDMKKSMESQVNALENCDREKAKLEAIITKQAKELEKNIFEKDKNKTVEKSAQRRYPMDEKAANQRRIRELEQQLRTAESAYDILKVDLACEKINSTDNQNMNEWMIWIDDRVKKLRSLSKFDERKENPVAEENEQNGSNANECGTPNNGQLSQESVELDVTSSSVDVQDCNRYAYLLDEETSISSNKNRHARKSLSEDTALLDRRQSPKHASLNAVTPNSRHKSVTKDRETERETIFKWGTELEETHCEENMKQHAETSEQNEADVGFKGQINPSSFQGCGDVDDGKLG